jgi:hypothetical protein
MQGVMMQKICFAICALILSISNAFAQTSIKLSTSNGANNEDLMHVMQLQDIQLSKIRLNATDLIGKNFQISLRDYSKGKLIKSHLIFDSKEDGVFTMKEKEFGFSVLAKKISLTKMRIDFRFIGFSVTKILDIKKEHQDFVLKNFQDNLDGINIPIHTNTSFLALLMPYQLPNKSMRYIDVALTDLKPEEFGRTFNVPRYFLLDIKID